MNPYIRFRAMRVMFVATLLICAAPVSIGTATADTFGSGLNTFDIEFVTIGNPGNAADTTGNPDPAGSVPYEYRIGKFEVSRDMVTKANAEGNLEIVLADMDDVTGGPRHDMPATGMSWNKAARFVNWLNTSEGFSPAYNFDTQPGDLDYDAERDYRSLARRGPRFQCRQPVSQQPGSLRFAEPGRMVQGGLLRSECE